MIVKQLQEVLAGMRKAATGRHVANALWNMADQAIYPLVMIFTLRIFMQHLGQQQFGIWMWVNTLVASLSFVNIGFGDATLKYVAEYQSKGQMKRAAWVISGTLYIYMLLALGLFVLCFVAAELTSAFNLHRVFKIDDANKEITIRAFELGAFTFALRLIESILLSALKGLQRFDASARLSIISKLSVLGLNVVLVMQGYSLVQLFINNAVVTAITVALEYYWVQKMVPGVRFMPSLRNPVLRQVRSFGFWAWLVAVINIANTQLDKYLVTALAGVNLFGFYAAAASIGERAQGVLGSAGVFIFPLITSRLAKKQPTLYLFYKGQGLLTAVSIAISMALVLVQKPLFTFIFKDEYANVAPYLHPFLLYIGVMGMVFVPHFFTMGAGLLRYSTYVRLVIIGLQVVLVPGAYYLFGPAYIPIGLLFAHYIGSYLHAGVLAVHLFKINPLLFGLQNGALPGLYLACMLAHQPVVFLVLAPVLWWFIFYRNERKYAPKAISTEPLLH